MMLLSRCLLSPLVLVLVGTFFAYGHSNTFNSYADLGPDKDEITFKKVGKISGLSDLTSSDGGMDLDGNNGFDTEKVSSPMKSDTLGEGGNNPVATAKNSENPSNFKLKQNYPNPFNPATEISYNLPVDQHVVLKVYDMLGRPVKTLVNQQQEAGSYSVRFNAGSLTSGMYLYRLETSSYEQIRKMILIK
jgi:hypothetical protein